MADGCYGVLIIIMACVVMLTHNDVKHIVDNLPIIC